MQDSNFKIVARDSLNWVKLPLDANTDNPKSKWNKVIAHREYLPDMLKVLEMTTEVQEMMNLYDDSLEVFKESNEWKFQDDIYSIDKPNREWIISKNGNFYMGHQQKDRVLGKLFEFFIKTNVMGGISIKQSLKMKMQGVKND